MPPFEVPRVRACVCSLTMMVDSNVDRTTSFFFLFFFLFIIFCGSSWPSLRNTEEPETMTPLCAPSDRDDSNDRSPLSVDLLFINYR